MLYGDRAFSAPLPSRDATLQPLQKRIAAFKRHRLLARPPSEDRIWDGCGVKIEGSLRPSIATRLLTGGTFFVRESESIGGFGVRLARAPAHGALSDFLSGGPRVENTPLSCGKQQTPEDSSAGALCKLVCRAISRLV
jgi:hypothetical protein